MTLPASGTISMSQVSTELGLGATSTRSLGDANVRSLAGVPSGPISFSNLHGKSASSPLGASKSGDAYGEYTCVDDPPWTVCPTTTSINTNTVTITASGGTGSYTYSWSKISGDTFTLSAPSGASTYFQASGVGKGESRSAVYRCTVSDGVSSVTVDVNVSAYYNNW